MSPDYLRWVICDGYLQRASHGGRCANNQYTKRPGQHPNRTERRNYWDGRGR